MPLGENEHALTRPSDCNVEMHRRVFTSHTRATLSEVQAAAIHAPSLEKEQCSVPALESFNIAILCRVRVSHKRTVVSMDVEASSVPSPAKQQLLVANTCP